MLRQNAKRAVFLCDVFYNRKDFLQPVDMSCGSVYRIGQRGGLFALTLVSVVKNIQQFGMIFKHHLIELFGNGLSMHFKHGNGGLNHFNRFCIQHV
ncbi:hypothetical protein D3C81_2081780 [compost metagenome]